jgi:hypothetical protein
VRRLAQGSSAAWLHRRLGFRLSQAATTVSGGHRSMQKGGGGGRASVDAEWGGRALDAGQELRMDGGEGQNCPIC